MKSYIILILTIACCLSWQHAEASIGISFVKNCSSQTSNDGEVEVAASGNAGPFTFYWGPGLTTTNKRTGLASGTYSVTVTNSFGCTFVRKGDVKVCAQPLPSYYQPIQISAHVLTPLSATGISDGSIDITVTGGYYGQLPQIYYKWVNFVTGAVVGTNQDITGLPAGMYKVTVTDGCTTTTQNFKIIACSDIVWNINSTIKKDCDCSSCAFCTACQDGSIVLTVSGGVGPYTFKWSNGSTSPFTIEGLTTGNYMVTITDLGSGGCTTSREFKVESIPVVVKKDNGCQWSATCDGKFAGILVGETEQKLRYDKEKNKCVTDQYCEGVVVHSAPTGTPTFKFLPDKCRGEVRCGSETFGEVVEIIYGIITPDGTIDGNCRSKATCTVTWPNGTTNSSTYDDYDHTVTCKTSPATETGCKIGQYCPTAPTVIYNQSSWGDISTENPYDCQNWATCPVFLEKGDLSMYRYGKSDNYNPIVSISPNPFNRYIDVYLEQFEKGEKVLVKVFNMLGLEIYSQIHTVQYSIGESVSVDLGNKGQSSLYNLVLVSQTSGFTYQTKLVQMTSEK
jgi:hypothetical protein